MIPTVGAQSERYEGSRIWSKTHKEGLCAAAWLTVETPPQPSRAPTTAQKSKRCTQLRPARERAVCAALYTEEELKRGSGRPFPSLSPRFIISRSACNLAQVEGSASFCFDLWPQTHRNMSAVPAPSASSGLRSQNVKTTWRWFFVGADTCRLRCEREDSV